MVHIKESNSIKNKLGLSLLKKTRISKTKKIRCKNHHQNLWYQKLLLLLIRLKCGKYWQWNCRFCSDGFKQVGIFFLVLLILIC